MMKKITLTLLLLLSCSRVNYCLAQTTMPAPIQTSNSAWLPSIMQTAHYQQLPIEQQQALAAIWHLEAKDYHHYLWLMQNTPNGWYYADKHLDPSWVLGFNAKDDEERKKFAAVAIQNERARIENELAFQKIFSSLQKELYPKEFPVNYQALDDNDSFTKQANPILKTDTAHDQNK